MWRALFVLAVTAGLAAAHVSTSVDDNNRFLKVTPLGVAPGQIGVHFVRRAEGEARLQTCILRVLFEAQFLTGRESGTEYGRFWFGRSLGDLRGQQPGDARCSQH